MHLDHRKSLRIFFFKYWYMFSLSANCIELNIYCSSALHFYMIYNYGAQTFHIGLLRIGYKTYRY
jgi:hypothetical protein